MRALVVFGLLLLVGCTSQIMAGYIGKSIKEPMLDYGPPINIIELDDNRRAYQWNIVSSGAIPITTPSSTTAYGPTGYTTVNTTNTTYIPYSDSCIYTLTAKKSGDDYIVDGFRKTSVLCE